MSNAPTDYLTMRQAAELMEVPETTVGIIVQMVNCLVPNKIVKIALGEQVKPSPKANLVKVTNEQEVVGLKK